MKLRIGFVSNSSSASFLLIGTDDPRIIDALIAAGGTTRERLMDDSWGGQTDFRDMTFVINGWEEIGFAGIDPLPWLETMTLPELRTAFVKRIHTLTGIEMEPAAVTVEYGESSSE